MSTKALRYTDFVFWKEIANNLGFKVQVDLYRINTFVAVDKEGLVCGFFIMDPIFFEGFLFRNFMERQAFEAGI